MEKKIEQPTTEDVLNGDFIDIRCMDLMIPIKYLVDENINARQKMILSVISIFKDGCRMSGEHFYQYIRIGGKYLEKALEKLCEDGYIRMQFESGERRIFVLK